MHRLPPQVLDAGGGVMKRLTFEGNFCDIAQCAETRGGIGGDEG